MHQSRPSASWSCLNCINQALPFSEQNSQLETNVNPTTLSTDKFNKAKLTLDQVKNMQQFSEIMESHMGENSGISCKYVEVENFESVELNPQNCLSFFHNNIASLPAHYDELRQLMTTPGFEFDIIAISETKLKVESPFCYSLPSYQTELTPCEGEKGGTLFFVSDRLKYSRRTEFETSCYLPKELESTFIEINRINKKNVIVGCIYRHPSMSVDVFNNEFLSPVLHKISMENKSVILLGDFNVDLLNPNNNAATNTFLDLIGSFSLIPQIVLPTRVTGNSGTIIDNIFCSSDFVNVVSGNILTAISDHLSQFLIIKNQAKVNTSLFREVRDWSKFDSDAFLATINSFDWKEILKTQLSDVNYSFNSFYDTINHLIDETAPHIKVHTHDLPKAGNPWMTKGILYSMKIRDQLHKKFLSVKNQQRKSFYLERFKKYRNTIVSLCRISKKNHYLSYFHENRNNIAKVWKGINSLISKKLSSPPPSTLLINGIPETDPQIIANTFNGFFTSAADKIRSKIPRTPKTYVEFLQNSNPKSLFLSPVTREDVLNCIHSLDSSKSTGPCSIPPRILKLIDI